jgi:surface antigen
MIGKSAVSKVALVGVLAIGLAACENTGPKEAGGGLIGAGLGGLAGSQIGRGSGNLAATGAGVLLGALLGSTAGKSLDRADRTYAERTTHNALETGRSGQPVAWTNPDTGHSGTIIPQPSSYQANTGQPCREYQQTIIVGGQQQQAYGTACRQPDGSWKVVN